MILNTYSQILKLAWPVYWRVKVELGAQIIKRNHNGTDGFYFWFVQDGLRTFWHYRNNAKLDFSQQNHSSRFFIEANIVYQYLLLAHSWSMPIFALYVFYFLCLYILVHSNCQKFARSDVSIEQYWDFDLWINFIDFIFICFIFNYVSLT